MCRWCVVITFINGKRNFFEPDMSLVERLEKPPITPLTVAGIPYKDIVLTNAILVF